MLSTHYPLQYNFTYNTRVSADFLTHGFMAKMSRLGLIYAKSLNYMMFQLFQRCSKNNFTYKNKMGLINRVLKMGKSLFLLYYIIFLLSKQYARKWSCSNVPSFFKWIYICISFFVALRKPHFVFVKTQKYIYLQKTWNIGTFFIINNLAWNKLGTTLHIFGTNLEQNMEQLNS